MSSKSSPIVTIPHHGGLGIKRFIARRFAKRAGQNLALAGSDLPLARKLVDVAGDRLPCAQDIKIEPAQIAGQTALTFTPQNPRPGTLLFFHGGGYMVGSAQSHKPFVSNLSKALNIKAISANYRLAPEHLAPAAAEDCEAILKTVQTDQDGPLIVAGDSAGGGVALASILRHRDAGRPMPAALYLISPWVDLTLTSNSVETEAQRDPMISPEGLKLAGQFYAGGGDVQSTDISPLLADLKGLPPVLIQVGQYEVLRDDSVNLAEKLQQAGVECRAEIWQAMFHDFQLFSSVISEGRAAIKSAKIWLEAYLLA